MRALIYSQDLLTSDVLKRSLAGNDFSRVEVQQKPAKIAPDDDEVVLFLDFDTEGVAGLASGLSDDQVVIPFGRHESRGKVPANIAAFYLSKPFTKEQIVSMVRTAVLNITDLAPTLRRQPKDANTGDLEKALKLALARVDRRRQDLNQILRATPDQLRAILSKSQPAAKDGRQAVPPDAIPIRSALIMDRDQEFVKMAARYLANKCVLQVTTESESEAGWKQLSLASFDVIIMEWESPKLSGLALYNRIRSSDRLRHVPLIVVSSQLKASDFRLLDEDFAATLLEKPVTEKVFGQALETVVGNTLVARAEDKELLSVAQRIVESKVSETVLASWLSPTKDATFLNALRLAGEKHLTEKRYRLAETAFSMAWELGDRRLCVLTGFGKACHLSGNHRRARRLLAKADLLAPKNVERLCLLGEVNLNLKQPQTARELFLSALAVDQRSIKAKAGVDVADALLSDRGKELPGAVGHFAGHLNLVGISLSKDRNTQEAIRYYNAAMTFVRKDEDLVKLWFNVGLCYLRGQMPDKAEDAFRRAYDLSGGSFSRAAAYIKKAEPSFTAADEEIEYERF